MIYKNGQYTQHLKNNVFLKLFSLHNRTSICNLFSCNNLDIVEQNWFAKNGMEHRDTKTQSFIF